MSEEFTENNEIPIEICAEEKEDTNLNPSEYYSTDGKDIRTGITTPDTLHDKTTTSICTELTNHTQRSKEIDKVVNQLLEALNEDNTPTSHEEKQKIINQYHHSDEDFVDIVINDWLTIDSWGNTSATEAVIPINFDEI